MSSEHKVIKITRRYALRVAGLVAAGGILTLALGERNEPTPPNAQQNGPKPGPARVAPVESPTAGFVQGITGDKLYPAPDATPVIEKAEAKSRLIQPLDDHYRNTAERIPGFLELSGKLPENWFNREMADAQLIPQVFENENTSERVSKATSYLERLRSYLLKNPHLEGPKLAELGNNIPENFPIALIKEATVSDLLELFLTNQKSGQIQVNNNPIIGASFYLGTAGNPQHNGKEWQITAQTWVNTLIIDEKQVQEQYGYARYQTTDLQVALKLIHEFSHFLQDKALMAEILNNTELMKQIGNDPAMMREAIGIKAQYHQDRIAQSIGLVGRNVSFNEAQANRNSMAVLEALRRVNGGNRVTGAEDDDPFIAYKKPLIQNFRDSNRNQTPAQKGLDIAWVLEHSNWGK